MKTEYERELFEQRLRELEQSHDDLIERFVIVIIAVGFAAGINMIWGF